MYPTLKKLSIILSLLMAGVVNHVTLAQCKVTAQTFTPTFCPDNSTGGCSGFINCSFTATSPTFKWSDGFAGQSETNMCAGTYTVTLTDASNGCTSTSSITLVTPTLFSASFVNTNPTSCSAKDGSVATTATGGTLPDAYAWSTGATTANLTKAAAGTYTLTVSDAHGCTFTKTTTLTCSTGIVENSDVKDLQVFPNPANSELNMELVGKTSSRISVKISNLLGEMVLSTNDAANSAVYKHQFDIAALPNGIYFLAVETDNKKMVRRFVKSGNQK